MKRMALAFTVLLASLVVAQQQGQPPPTPSPPYQTPQSSPEEPTTPRQFPPDTEAPPTKSTSAQEAEQQITRHLRSEPTLSDTNLDAKVDQSSVVLTGTVNSERQHQLALGIAQSYAAQRKIIDKIKVRQHT